MSYYCFICDKTIELKPLKTNTQNALHITN